MFGDLYYKFGEISLNIGLCSFHIDSLPLQVGPVGCCDSADKAELNERNRLGGQKCSTNGGKRLWAELPLRQSSKVLSLIWKRCGMGRFDTFEIRYDNVLGVFYAGQLVTGVVGIQLSEPMKVEKILIEFKGRAKTHWTRHQGKSSTHYSLEVSW